VEGTGTLSRLLRMADANQVVRAQQFSHFVAGGTTDALRQYRADLGDLREEQDALEREQGSREDAFEDLRKRRSEAIREVEGLGRLAEQARAARAAEEQARAAAANRAAAASSAEAASTPVPTEAPRAAPAPTEPRRAAPAPSPAAPAARPAEGGASVGSAEWVCPVQGPRAFSNDYGAPRGGGASHQGNDILAPRGTPVVANVSGVVTQRNGAISGLAYFLAGDDGNRYFGAHLDSFGASGRVSAGTVIGTVGDTGDAKGGPPHLHFEIHPGGSGNVNPYPTLKKYC
jgi:murein DD-endopeptidase MepM/ murein hydrolase activator NlpD